VTRALGPAQEIMRACPLRSHFRTRHNVACDRLRMPLLSMKSCASTAAKRRPNT
jgi:hypothetical protein